MTVFDEHDNEVLDRIIEERRSVRAFTDESPTDEMLKGIVHAGLWAPYAGIAVGSEDFRRFFVIRKGSPVLARVNELFKQQTKINLEQMQKPIQDKPALQEKSRTYLERMRGFVNTGFPGFEQVPAFIIAAERRGMPPAERQSLAHIIENMWLKVTALGLGMQLVSMTSNLTESREFCELVGLPFGEFAFNGCIVGYPKEPPAQGRRPADESITTWL